MSLIIPTDDEAAEPFNVTAFPDARIVRRAAEVPPPTNNDVAIASFLAALALEDEPLDGARRARFEPFALGHDFGDYEEPGEGVFLALLAMAAAAIVLGVALFLALAGLIRLFAG